MCTISLNKCAQHLLLRRTYDGCETDGISSHAWRRRHQYTAWSDRRDNASLSICVPPGCDTIAAQTPATSPLVRDTESRVEV